jgi:hypothetical protein
MIDFLLLLADYLFGGSVTVAESKRVDEVVTDCQPQRDIHLVVRAVQR